MMGLGLEAFHFSCFMFQVGIKIKLDSIEMGLV